MLARKTLLARATHCSIGSFSRSFKFEAGLANIEAHLGLPKRDVRALLQQPTPGGFDENDRVDRVLAWADVGSSEGQNARDAYASLHKSTAFDRVFQFASPSCFSLADLLTVYEAVPRTRQDMLATVMQAVINYVREPLAKTDPWPRQASPNDFGQDVSMPIFLRACIFDDHRYRRQMLPLVRTVYAHCDKTFLAFALRNVRRDALSRGIMRHTGPFDDNDDISSRILETRLLAVEPGVKRAFLRLLVLRDMPLSDLRAVAVRHGVDPGCGRRTLEYALLGNADVDDDIMLDDHHFNKPLFEEVVPLPSDLFVHGYVTSLFPNVTSLRSICELKSILARPSSCPLRQYLLHHYRFFDDNAQIACLHELRASSDRSPLSGLEQVMHLPPERLISHVRLSRGMLKLLDGYGVPLILGSSPLQILSLARTQLSERLQGSSCASLVLDEQLSLADARIKPTSSEYVTFLDADRSGPCATFDGEAHEHALLIPVALELETEHTTAPGQLSSYDEY